MGKIKEFIARNPDLFVYQTSHEVHPHDQLMAWTVLKLFSHKVTPNKVTLFRIIATPVVFFLILFDHYLVGTIAFVLVAFTDAIDGSMARTRNQITKFGMLFDPLADKLLIGSLVLILVFRYYNFWLGITILGLEIAFILSALVVKYKFKTVRAANVWGKIKMILQVTAVFLTLIALWFDHPELLYVGAWVFGLAIGFAVVSLFAHGV
jgi:CDP-diacylglycerol--glycerol-3-phosphate 3-phosphatidyltransferase